MRIRILEVIDDMTANSTQYAHSKAISEALGMETELIESCLATMIKRGWLIGQLVFTGWQVRLSAKTVLFLTDD